MGHIRGFMTEAEVRKKYLDCWFVAWGDGAQVAVDDKMIIVAIAPPAKCDNPKGYIGRYLGKPY